MEDVDLAGGQLVGHDTGGDLLAVLVLGQHNVERVGLVVELDVVRTQFWYSVCGIMWPVRSAA